MSTNATQSAPAETLSIDQAGRGIQVALTAVLLIVAVAAFCLGALPLISIAHEWAELPLAVAALLPIALDAAAVAAALAAIVRHVREQRAGLEMVLLALTVLVSVAAQVVHAWTVGGGIWDPRTIVIAATLGSAPIIVLLSSHAAIRTLTPPRQKTKRSARRTPAPAAAQASAPAKVAKPAAVKPAAPKPPADLPGRLPDEADLAYAVRLIDHGISQRGAATAAGAGVTRSKIETALKNRAAEADQFAAPALAA